MLRVLVVCTGNICRSPIAHGLLEDRSRRLTDGQIEVRSAGTWARRGSPATSEAVAAAEELGIDVHGHRSTPFARELADWGDLVVTMTGEQREEVLQAAPDARSKTFTLKELVSLLDSLPDAEDVPIGEPTLERIGAANRLRDVPGRPTLVDEDVVDPLGLSQLTYRAVAHEIEGLVDGLVRGLAGHRTPAAAQEG